MKALLLLLIISILMLTNCQDQTSQQQIQESDNMAELSRLIIGTIEKYDHTEKGVIPLSKYDQFLHQIFVEGNKFNTINGNDEKVPEEISNLLREATTEFRKFRYEQQNQQQQKDQKESKQPQKRQFVELQQFYMDLIKHFSEFLDLPQNQERFRSVNEFFFVKDQTQTIQQNNEQNDDKIQL